MVNKSYIKGKFAENISILYLICKGYKPLSMNDKSGNIESDIIASKQKEIVLVEVKWRQNTEKGHYAIHPTQKVRLKNKLRYLKKRYPQKELSIHLMLICPTPPFIEHIKNPF
jgi:Holliday junction resolvase-like predicted endonuclease